VSRPSSLTSRSPRSLLGGRLTSVPHVRDVAALIEVVHNRLASALPGLAGTLDPYRLCEHFGWQVRVEQLGARVGGQQAALLPRWGGGFTVLVDPDLTPAERSGNADPVIVARFRVAHELAHTLFYSETAPPRRAVALSPQEEGFCDAFAWALVSSSPLQPV
jgi:hypothetical protein